jgi:hypothetical protein
MPWSHLAVHIKHKKTVGVYFCQDDQSFDYTNTLKIHISCIVNIVNIVINTLIGHTYVPPTNSLCERERDTN